MNRETRTHIIVGGGAAGMFCAINLKKLCPHDQVIVLEKTLKLLSKVKISGGGRCNVTHHCFDPARLVENYPRGRKELRGLFTRFGPAEMIRWLEERGVETKVERDGRMFPITDSSQTIIDCFMKEAESLGVEIVLRADVEKIYSLSEGKFTLNLKDGRMYESDSLVLATGSSSAVWELISALGHTCTSPVPSLFTFNTPNSPLLDLMGISVPKGRVKIPSIGFEQIGPILITHWGLSGPAVLKLSAFAARALHEKNYMATCEVNWLGEGNMESIQRKLEGLKPSLGKYSLYSEKIFDLPSKLWERLLQLSNIEKHSRFAEVSKEQIRKLATLITAFPFEISGKTTFKEEFVTCGGVSLKEVDFTTLESRKCKNLFFAGEILDVDGITGGFNFQNAWSTAFISAHSIALKP